MIQGVSVCVITYNHAAYIKECLNSIIAQKTDFPIEVVVRDDNSTDCTKQKILEIVTYNTNENITFKIIDGSVNLGANENILKVIDNCTYEYIAFCEGDDYWTDELKLNKQYKYAKDNLHCDFFVHPAYYKYSSGEIKQVKWPIQFSNSLDTKMILNASWQFAPTSSYFIKKNALLTLPEWFGSASIGDIFIEIYSARNGILMQNEYMSAYRYLASGSWSLNLKGNSENIINKAIKHYENFNDKLMKVKVDFPELSSELDKKIANNNFQLSILYFKIRKIDKYKYYTERCMEFSKELNVKKRIFLKLKYFPTLLRLLMKLNRVFS